jgi:hypothetical protein
MTLGLLGGLTFNSEAGAAYVVQNYNWWLNGRDHAFHVAADHWSDGTWHVTGHRYGYGGGGYKDWAFNVWMEDWACPQPFNGNPGTAPALVVLETGYHPSHPTQDFCAAQYGVWRPGSGGNNINWVTADNNFDWYKSVTSNVCSGPCIYKAANTGLMQDEPNWTDRDNTNGKVRIFMY